MRPIDLSPRLRSVAELVPGGARFADVGTDHAYLPAYLLQKGVIRHAVVSDLRRGPLERARATAERWGLTGQMEFRLCDGLSGIGSEEADTIAIAGMGGETIAAILEAAPWTREGARRLLLQPMSAQPYLRTWLEQNGYTIAGETLSREGDSLYLTLLVGPGAMPPMSPAQRWAGRQTRDMDAPLRGAYLARLLAQTGRAIEGLGRSHRPEDAVRRAELEEVRRGLQDMKEEWDTWQL